MFFCLTRWNKYLKQVILFVKKKISTCMLPPCFWNSLHIYFHSFYFLTGTGGPSDKPLGILESHLSTEITLVCRPNRSDTTDDCEKMFRMSHGLTNTALALSPLTADAEVWHLQIEAHPMQQIKYP